MVTVAQLVEPRTVTPVVVGSSPISHPITISSNAMGLIGQVIRHPGDMGIKELSTLDGRRTKLIVQI